MIVDRRLLILDDDRAVAATMSRMARQLGVTVRHVQSLERFREEFADFKPTDLFIDLLLENADTLALIAQLKTVGRACRIYLVSGAGEGLLMAVKRIVEDQNFSISGLLSKPLSRSEILQALEMPAPVAPTQADAAMPRFNSRRLIADFDESIVHVQYQPIFQAQTRRLAGFEALVRLRHPIFGLISPDQFKAVMSQPDLHLRLTVEVFRQAFDWADRHLADSDLGLSLNLSPTVFSNSEFALSWAENMLQRRPSRRPVTIEITEDQLQCDEPATLAILTRLRLAGYRLAIDDFGTGFSTFQRLAEFPFSALKIDRRFVSRCRLSGQDLAIVRSCIRLAHELGLEVTAEGVEDEATTILLETLGVDYLQGYHLSRPVGERTAGRLSRTAA